MCKYEMGDKIKIIDGGIGAQGCNGCEGIVTSKTNENGIPEVTPGFNIELIKIKDKTKDDLGVSVGEVWRVNLKGKYQLVSE